MKKRISVLLALVMLLSLCACGAKSAQTMASAPAEAPAMAYDSATMEEAAEIEYGGFAAEDNAMGAETGSESTAPAVDPEKIIYSADATIETTDFDGTVTALSRLVSEYGGFVESSSISTGNYYQKARGYSSRSASYTLRIPSENFSTLMGSLSKLGNVPYSYTYSENISSQYYDVAARLTAYETQEERLLEMMELAETVEEIIIIEDRLSELRYNIEKLQSTINNWDRQVSYSSVSLQVQEVSEYTPEPAITYGQELWTALKSAVRDMGRFFKDFLVFIVSALPTLIILGLLFIILHPAIKKRREKRRAKREAQGRM